MGYRLQDGGQIDVDSVCGFLICFVAYLDLAAGTIQKARTRDQLYHRQTYFSVNYF